MRNIAQFSAVGLAVFALCAAAPRHARPPKQPKPAKVAEISAPELAWKAGIAGENKDYALIPHAMLKIQDAVYLGEGQGAVLQGAPGKPASWHWNSDPRAHGVLSLFYARGNLTVTRNGKPVAGIAKSIPIARDVDIAGQPTQVGAGVQGWRIFVYNQRAPAASAFKGVGYYPYDKAFRVTASFAPDAKLAPHVFRTSRGTDKMFYHAGDARFTLKGKQVALPFYTDGNRPGAISDMTAFYTDTLTGNGAYGAGRYVDAEKFGKFPPARVTIDFNNAYNPNCARSSFFTCPVAIDAIAVPVAAGERDPHILH
jgi:uncharacterized protein (DUF1684 family)